MKRSRSLPAAVLIVLAAVLPALPAVPLPERVLVTDVADGDTLFVLAGRKQETVRLIGVDTPETGRPGTPVRFYGPEATDFTLRSLKGRRVRLEFEEPGRPGEERDAYGRLLAYVFTDDGRNFNLELVRLGFGRAYTRYSFRHQRAFVEAEREARRAATGLWNAASRGAWADPARRGRVIGNLRTRIYHVPGQPNYGDVKEKNRIHFRTEDEAQAAGYRKAKN
jgi:micrococcal nuclease